jgi:hypothetical protein
VAAGADGIITKFLGVSVLARPGRKASKSVVPYEVT